MGIERYALQVTRPLVTAKTFYPISREHTGDRQLDAIQQTRDQIARTLRATPLGDAILVTGTLDGNGIISDGVSFGASASVEFAHGLGRPYTAALPVAVFDNGVVLQDDRTNLTAGLENTHCRLKNTTALTARAYFLVF